MHPEHTVKRKLRIGKDLDGCYYSFDGAYYDALVTLGVIGDSFETPYRPAQTWEFYADVYGHTLEQFLAFCDLAADAGLLWSGPVMPGGKAAWIDLAADGHEIHVKTDRSFGSHPIASQVGTRTWLHTERLPHQSVTFTANKLDGPEVDVMLEDKLSNYDTLDAAGVQVWLMDRPWNQDPGDSRRRVYSHDEFVTRVRALAAQEVAGVPA